MNAEYDADGETIRVTGTAEDGKWSGWSFTARGDAIAMHAPDGITITAAHWKAAPIGRVLARARHILREPALALTLEALAAEGIAPHSRQRGDPEHELVARVWRTAVRHGASAPEAVAAIFQISKRSAEDRAIPDARAAGALDTDPEERRQHPPTNVYYTIDGQVKRREHGGPRAAEWDAEWQRVAGQSETARDELLAFLDGRDATPELITDFVTQYNDQRTSR